MKSMTGIGLVKVKIKWKMKGMVNKKKKIAIAQKKKILKSLYDVKIRNSNR